MSLREHACVSSRGAQSTELVSLYIGYWTLNNYYYYYYYNRHKNKLAPYTVSMHLATRGNNKILRTPPQHISSSEDILLRLTRRTLSQLKQINHHLSNHTYTKTTPNYINHHYAPFLTLTQTTHIISSTSPTYTTLSPLDLWQTLPE